MIRDKEREKSEDGVTQNNEGLKRRDLLLSGTSLMAASALTGAGFATSRASAATGSDAAIRETAEHRLHHG